MKKCARLRRVVTIYADMIVTGKTDGMNKKYHVNNQSNPSDKPQIQKLQTAAFWDVTESSLVEMQHQSEGLLPPSSK
jgi:hypothetical protein